MALAEIISTFQVGTELADHAPFLIGAIRTEVLARSRSRADHLHGPGYLPRLHRLRTAAAAIDVVAGALRPAE